MAQCARAGVGGVGCVPWDCPWLLSSDACPYFPALGALGTFRWFGSTVPRDLPQSCLVPYLGSIRMLPAHGVHSPPCQPGEGLEGLGTGRATAASVWAPGRLEVAP